MNNIPLSEFFKYSVLFEQLMSEGQSCYRLVRTQKRSVHWASVLSYWTLWIFEIFENFCYWLNLFNLQHSINKNYSFLNLWLVQLFYAFGKPNLETHNPPKKCYLKTKIPKHYFVSINSTVPSFWYFGISLLLGISLLQT